MDKHDLLKLAADPKYISGMQQPILNFVASLESIRRRVEAQFPHARAFVRPGLDDV